MKKKVMVPVVLGIILIIGILYFVIRNQNISIILLDINPSIEIHITKEEKVQKVIPLNDDAKNVVDKKLNGIELEDAFPILIENMINKGYIKKEEPVEIILYKENRNSKDKTQEKLEKALRDKEMVSDIILVKSISSQDKRLAKKYKISPAKVSYIKSIMKENKNVSLDDLANKQLKELKETKERGKYCESDYTLEGDFCFKEMNRKSANPGEVCPRGYYDYQGICYEEIALYEGDNYTCREDFQLVEDKCVKEETGEAFGKCEKGIYDQGYCVVKELLGEAEEYCRITPETDILMDHKCYGPKPLINGGCLNGDSIINGGCVDFNSYYESDYRCSTGNLELDNKCYQETKTEPKSYYCEGNAKLKGKTCILKEEEKAEKEKVCPSGYTLVDSNRCINENNKTSKENGFVCDKENERVENNICIEYEIIEAKSNEKD